MNKILPGSFLVILQAPILLTSSSPSYGCIDDSDCVPLGHQYACYFYKCLNWMDKNTGLQHCSRDSECGASRRCYRHHNLREVSAGICFPASQLDTCSNHQECQGDTQYCCGMWCCPQEYFRQWKNFSCVTDQQCRTWNTGQFCCEESKCCDSDEGQQMEDMDELEEIEEEDRSKSKEHTDQFENVMESMDLNEIYTTVEENQVTNEASTTAQNETDEEKIEEKNSTTEYNIVESIETVDKFETSTSFEHLNGNDMTHNKEMNTEGYSEFQVNITGNPNNASEVSIEDFTLDITVDVKIDTLNQGIQENDTTEGFEDQTDYIIDTQAEELQPITGPSRDTEQKDTETDSVTEITTEEIIEETMNDTDMLLEYNVTEVGHQLDIEKNLKISNTEIVEPNMADSLVRMATITEVSKACQQSLPRIVWAIVIILYIVHQVSYNYQI